MITYELRPTPTQHAFLKSSAVICALIGPQGEGKTWIGSVALWDRAWRWKAKTGMAMPGAIIRDVHTNIKRMTVPSLIKAFNHLGLGAHLRWRDDFKKLTCADGSFDIDLFGMDDLGALTRIQGAEYAWIWLEEPAPMIERANAGLSQEVFDACISRVARAISTEYQAMGLMPRLQITMNPADEEHWTFHELIENPRFPSAMYPDIDIEVLNIPYAENPYQSDISRQATKAAFMGNEGLRMRYVEGRFAFVQVGAAVTPEYVESIHRSSINIDPIPGCQGWRFWDGGLNPTCIICQTTPSGRLFVLDSFVGSNIGMGQLIDNHVIPILTSRYSKVTRWRDIGDPALKNREQSDSDHTAAKVIEAKLGTTFEPGPVSWDERREALKTGLSRLADGGPYILLSHHEGKLHRALRGGWHYKKDATGRIMTNDPVKDMHSHPGDAFGYGLSVVLGRYQGKNDVSTMHPGMFPVQSGWNELGGAEISGG